MHACMHARFSLLECVSSLLNPLIHILGSIKGVLQDRGGRSRGGYTGVRSSYYPRWSITVSTTRLSTTYNKSH